MSRVSVLIVAALALLVGWLSRGQHTAPQEDRSRIVRDSLRLDSLDRAASVRRACDSIRLDSLREAFRTRPIREVIKRLPGYRDTITYTFTAPVESVTVATPMLRETADSLETCRFDRRSLRDSLAVSRASDSTARRQLRDARAPAPRTVQATGRTASAIGVASFDAIRVGALVQRHLGPLSIGAGITASPVNLNPAAVISAGISW